MPDDHLSESSDFEAHDFHPDPKTPRQYLAALWQKVNVIDSKVTQTNGRVSRLEKFMWAISGGIIVVAVILVPLLLHLLETAKP